MYAKLKRWVCVLLLFAAALSLACNGNNSNAGLSNAAEITDLQMVLLCDVVYRDVLGKYYANGQELPSDDDHSPIRDDYLKYMYDRVLAAQLSGFTVVDYDCDDKSGFKAACFKKNNNIIVAYCGTENYTDVLAGIASGLFDTSKQDDRAKQFAKDNARKHSDCNIYVSGYSLGGRLAYLGTEAIIDNGYKDRLIRTCTFNGLGVIETISFSDPNLSNIHRLEAKMEAYTVNYIVNGDEVSDGWINDRYALHDLSHIGKRVYYDCTTPEELNLGYIELPGIKLLSLSKHDLYTFIDKLSEHLKGSRPFPAATDNPIIKQEPLHDFSIIGSWKSIGDSGFGQAQPGSIVTFDEEHCNFYSPNDTYSLYRSGEDILLECTSTLFSDTLMFNVVIIDDNNIQIQYGSVTTKLKRLDTSLGEGPGAEPPNFSIVGSWKSVGDWGFGQAQPGATVRFDGSRCNFYSPYDTYEFYKEDGKWKLSCKNVLWQDVLTFTVEIIDNDNINIYYGSSYVTILKRVD